MDDFTEQPDILIVIPARGGSKRLPGKNTMALAGASLLERTTRFLVGEGRMADAILSTDDAMIADAGRKAGLAVPFIRPAELASDAAPTLDVLLHALRWHEGQHGRLPELVAVLQVTTPFRRHGLLTDAIGILARQPRMQSVVAMVDLGLSPRSVFVRDTTGRVQRLQSSVEGNVWVPSGALYLTRSAALIAQNSIFAEPIATIETAGLEAIDVDTPEDFAIAAAMVDRAPLASALRPRTLQPEDE